MELKKPIVEAINPETKEEKRRSEEMENTVEDRMVRRHNNRYYDRLDTMQTTFVDASLIEDFGERDRKVESWTREWERETGATEAEIKRQNDGRK